ncbi:hypothetical protein LTR66_008424 [Elasticomyces elasticus]|nr:hypothetical protein LTR66_008424 [Elasticomyces elasticus]
MAFASKGSLHQASDFLLTLPQQLQPGVLEARQPAWATFLRRMWTSTRNFDRVQELFGNMQNVYGRPHLPLPVYNVMFRICIEAGHSGGAENYLRQLQTDNEEGPDLETFGHLMLSAATGGDWHVIDVILAHLHQTGRMGALSRGCGPFFNDVLREYARRHEAQDVWEFCSCHIEHHSVVPDQRTFDLVLEAFVKGKNLSLIPRWVRYMKVGGFELRINARTAAMLIQRYYLEQRPSHTALMWICRKLCHWSKNLVNEELYLLVRDAIGFDLRGAKPKNIAEFRENCAWRLAQLDRFTQQIPPPVQREYGTRLESPLGVETSHSLLPTSLAHDGGMKASTEVGDAENSSPLTGSPYSTSALPNSRYIPVSSSSMEHPNHSSDIANNTNENVPLIDGSYVEKQGSYTLNSHSSVRLSTSVLHSPGPSFQNSKDFLERRETESNIMIALSLDRPAKAIEIYDQSLRLGGILQFCYVPRDGCRSKHKSAR